MGSQKNGQKNGKMGSTLVEKWGQLYFFIFLNGVTEKCFKEKWGHRKMGEKWGQLYFFIFLII
jgi:cbb3-type cytochrome oxidase subunit 3